jgi:hypothetical protein
MILILTRRQLLCFFAFFSLTIFGLVQVFYWLGNSGRSSQSVLADQETVDLIRNIFGERNQAIIEDNLARSAALYERGTRYGVWAYEHQAQKMKYLRNWFFKQGAQLADIKFKINLCRMQRRDPKIRLTLRSATEYYYIYPDQPSLVNMMRLGAYHSIDLIEKEGRWKIAREWYLDPLADSLAMDHEQAVAVREVIALLQTQDLSNLCLRRLNAVAYADKYCGAASPSEYQYNFKYRNYNYSGGDCANFVSQVLYEGAGFRKTLTWNYEKDASQAWSNAQAFNRYMLYSGRASRIAYGDYQQVLKASYQLLPGDYVAYEKKGKVTHVSVVTGADSKGYPLTNSHNADRYRVPWDLGFGGKRIRFWLVRVHY